MNVLWSNARSRAIHKDFGDIITFDTTFLCNMYRMLFASFFGVSHHGKSIVFAAALLSHEGYKDFCCTGSKPKGILIVQCKAIGKAVDNVFVEMPHRLCLWHILLNASKNLEKFPSGKK
ncbi:Protein FAR1-RELATED SEQUENCE 8 [Bienertia sinuspersici]